MIEYGKESSLGKQGLRSAESEPSVRVRCSFAEDKTGAIGKYSSDRK